ncbi:Zinc finger CCCH domain-containing protein 48 [Vitis vinifera]|uniref:Zinc finger CCCH domain-containing protein 48 n=1 Tax=Vitis vinifera TaxID=29760 RepID=A0A438K4L1_VITVI|nr:Zinc finger CCCH domain-containing protein 48 [Vitis vinifera]
MVGDKNERGRRHVNNMVCSYWLRGRCNRNPCRSSGSTTPKCSSASNQSHRNNRERTLYSDQKGEWDSTNLTCSSSPTRAGSSSGNGITQKVIGERVCKYWLHGNCVEADKCQYLHSWFKGHGVFKLAELNGHIKAISGIVLPSGSEKLYTASRDGYIRVWDCHTGQCDGVSTWRGNWVLNQCRPWVFAGIKDVVKAWNIEYCANLSLDGPVGKFMLWWWIMICSSQGQRMALYMHGNPIRKPMLLSWLQHWEATIVLWFRSQLVVGAIFWFHGQYNKMYSYSEGACISCDVSCCWGPYLISCSLDQTIKVWFATEAGNLEVTYTHNEEHGVLALFGMFNSEGKPILLCSCNDNSVRLYELPSFTERARIFAKEEVRAIQIGPGGLFFIGDGTGQVDVWKWQAEPTSLAS